MRNLVFGIVFAVLAAISQSASANPGSGPVINASVGFGVDQDTTAIGRLHAGGLWNYWGIAGEVHLGVDGFLRIDSSKGISAKALTAEIGGRYALLDALFRGPYIGGAIGYGFFLGKPHERKISGDADLCESANIPADQPQDECTYRIDRNISLRASFGWGFRSGEKATVGVRLDATYYLLSLNDYEDQPSGAPIPNQVSRPQGAFAVLVGLEFLRFR